MGIRVLCYILIRHDAEQGLAVFPVKRPDLLALRLHLLGLRGRRLSQCNIGEMGRMDDTVLPVVGQFVIQLLPFAPRVAVMQRAFKEIGIALDGDRDQNRRIEFVLSRPKGTVVGVQLQPGRLVGLHGELFDGQSIRFAVQIPPFQIDVDPEIGEIRLRILPTDRRALRRSSCTLCVGIAHLDESRITRRILRCDLDGIFIIGAKILFCHAEAFAKLPDIAREREFIRIVRECGFARIAGIAGIT